MGPIVCSIELLDRKQWYRYKNKIPRLNTRSLHKMVNLFVFGRLIFDMRNRVSMPEQHQCMSVISYEHWNASSPMELLARFDVYAYVVRLVHHIQFYFFCFACTHCLNRSIVYMRLIGDFCFVTHLDWSLHRMGWALRMALSIIWMGKNNALKQ